MSFGGTVHAAIISLKNNLGLRKGRSYFNKKQRLQRKVNPAPMRMKKRTPQEFKALAEQHYQRSRMVRKKQALFLIFILILTVLIIWALY
jgi:hypothetical protein